MEQNIYKNILVIVVGFMVINWFFDLEYFEIAALTIGVLSIVISKAAIGINWLWIKLALGLGWVNSRILLSILYYIFLVPIALLARIFKGNSLDIKNERSSMYEVRNHLYNKDDLVDMW